MSILSSGNTDARPGRSRRTFLTSTLGVAAGVAGLTVSSALPATAEDDADDIQGTQSNWRFCDKCCLLFFDGYPSKGFCPGGGGHRAQGWNFYLHYDFPGAPNWQIGWRFCNSCYSLWWPFASDTFGHQAQGWVFALNHDVGETPFRQQHWRYCRNCHGLFYWGFADNGRCHAGGGGHVERGVRLRPVPLGPAGRLDEANRAPGQDREEQIQETIKSSAVVLVLLS